MPASAFENASTNPADYGLAFYFCAFSFNSWNSLNFMTGLIVSPALYLYCLKKVSSHIMYALLRRSSAYYYCKILHKTKRSYPTSAEYEALTLQAL